jgi:hypothetical protein
MNEASFRLRWEMSNPAERGKANTVGSEAEAELSRPESRRFEAADTRVL